MKNNLLNKIFIESDDVYDFRREFAWLTRVHFFFLIKCCFFTDFVLQRCFNSSLSILIYFFQD